MICEGWIGASREELDADGWARLVQPNAHVPTGGLESQSRSPAVDASYDAIVRNAPRQRKLAFDLHATAGCLRLEGEARVLIEFGLDAPARRLQISLGGTGEPHGDPATAGARQHGPANVVDLNRSARGVRLDSARDI